MTRFIRHILAAFATSLIILPALAAPPKIQPERPDMEKIRKEVTDPKSRYYYPKLMERYERNETINMNLQDYRHLYLGMIFQEDYNPYRKSPYAHYVDELYFKKEHSRRELDSIDKYARLVLEDNPFDLEQINFLIYSLRKRGKNNLANIWQFRLNHLIEAILSTGTGLDTDNAWIIIDPKHEYNIVNFQNAIVDKVEFTPPYYEYVRLTSSDNDRGSDKRPEGFFFDIRHILSEYNRKFPDEE